MNGAGQGKLTAGPDIPNAFAVVLRREGFQGAAKDVIL
jgi:hypothetical protein